MIIYIGIGALEFTLTYSYKTYLNIISILIHQSSTGFTITISTLHIINSNSVNSQISKYCIVDFLSNHSKIDTIWRYSINAKRLRLTPNCLNIAKKYAIILRLSCNRIFTILFCKGIDFKMFSLTDSVDYDILNI